MKINFSRFTPDIQQIFFEDLDPSNSILPVSQLIEFGDSLINFLALLYGNCLIEKSIKSPKVIIPNHFIKDLFRDYGAINFSLSLCILKDANQWFCSLNEKSLAPNIGTVLTEWAHFRNKIRKVKRHKAYNNFRDEVSILLNKIIDGCTIIENLKIKDGNFFKKELLIPLNPFFIFYNCHKCDKKHLFVFDSYTFKQKEGLYICWTNGHTLEINNKIPDIVNRLDTIRSIILKNEESNPHQSSYLPLFASSYPAMSTLVDLLYDECHDETKKDLWLTASLKEEFINAKNKIFELLKGQPIKLVNNNMDLKEVVENFLTSSDDKALKNKIYQIYEPIKQKIKNKILIDCVEKDPISVLVNVTVWEGKNELHGYLRKLLMKESNNNERETMNALKAIDQLGEQSAKECSEFSRNVDKNEVNNEIYAKEIAKRLGFPIKDMQNYHNIDYYINSLTRELSSIKISSINDDVKTRDVLVKWFPKLELIYRELVMFYSYVANNMSYNKSVKKEGQTVFDKIKDEKINEKDKDDKLTMGDLNTMLCKLHHEFSEEKDTSLEKWGRIGIFSNIHKYYGVTRSGNKNGDIFLIRNDALHGNPNKLLDINKVDNCCQLLEWIKDILCFFADPNYRIFPYKISFTLFTQTHHGIRTCKYKTDLTDLKYLNNAKEIGQDVKIYTDYEIDFSKYYYCLPNVRLSLDNMWINPLLIPIDSVSHISNIST